MAQLTPFGIGRFNKNATQQLPQTEDALSFADQHSRFNVLRNLKEKVCVQEKPFFDQFFIIGVTPQQLRARIASPDVEVLQAPPEQLFMFHEDPAFERVEKEKQEMVLDFCFPTGVSAQKLQVHSKFYEQRVAAEQDLEKILWGSKNWRENMFTFTLESADLGQEANSFE